MPLKVTTEASTTGKELVTFACISGDLDVFIINALQIDSKLINKTTLHLSSFSQTNAGALWFTRHIRLLYEIDASWLLAERSTGSVFPTPSVFRHFASWSRNYPEVQLVKVCWESARLKNSEDCRQVVGWSVGSRSHQCKMQQPLMLQNHIYS